MDDNRLYLPCQPQQQRCSPFLTCLMQSGNLPRCSGLRASLSSSQPYPCLPCLSAAVKLPHYLRTPNVPSTLISGPPSILTVAPWSIGSVIISISQLRTEAQGSYVTRTRIGEMELGYAPACPPPRNMLSLWHKSWAVKTWLALASTSIDQGCPETLLSLLPFLVLPWHPNIPPGTLYTFSHSTSYKGALVITVLHYQETQKVTFSKSVHSHSQCFRNQFYSLFIFLCLCSLFEVISNAPLMAFPLF